MASGGDFRYHTAELTVQIILRSHDVGPDFQIAIHDGG